MALFGGWVLGAFFMALSILLRDDFLHHNSDLDLRKPGDSYYVEHMIACSLFWPLTVAHFLLVRVYLAGKPFWTFLRRSISRRRSEPKRVLGRERRRVLQDFDRRLAGSASRKVVRDAQVKR